MPFGYSKKIFKYPPVQYIPLDQYYKITGETLNPYSRTKLHVFNQFENKDLERKLAYLRLEKNYTVKKGQLAVLIINGKADLLQYRGHEISIVGQPATGHYQLFKITTQYFYKDRLIFIFYDGEDSEKIDWFNYNRL